MINHLSFLIKGYKNQLIQKNLINEDLMQEMPPEFGKDVNEFFFFIDCIKIIFLIVDNL